MNIVIDEFVDKPFYFKKISNDKVINITGEAGSGKSTLANQYREDEKYLVVDFDLIMLNPEIGTIEYELQKMLREKYGESIFQSVNEIGLDGVKKNFTKIYSEIINYLSNKDKTIVLDGSQLRFIDDVKKIKGDFVALRPSIKTCLEQSKKRFIENNPNASEEEINSYVERRTKKLYQLNPMMNQLLQQVDKLSIYGESNSKFDIQKMEQHLNELAKNYLNLIRVEYGEYLSEEQKSFLNNLLNSDCIKVELSGREYLLNQYQEVMNDETKSTFQKIQELRGINIPLAHGGRVYNDNIIHFYPSIISGDISSEERLKIFESILIHELLHYFIRPQSVDTIGNEQLKGINSFTTEGLVDMCARDIQVKYGLYPDYSSDYGPNVIFVREALSNIPNTEDRMKLVFNGSIEQFYGYTTTQEYNSIEHYIESKNKTSEFDNVISSICSIVSNDSGNIESMKKSTYNYSANFSSKNDALIGIRNFGLSTFPDKAELIDKIISSYSDSDVIVKEEAIEAPQADVENVIGERSKPNTRVLKPSKNASNNGFVNIFLLLFMLGIVFGLSFIITYMIIK